MWKFPEVTTPIEGYYRCGDSTTSGIGVPAVASSGAICANSIMSVWDQLLKLNSKIKMPVPSKLDAMYMVLAHLSYLFERTMDLGSM